MPGLRRGDRAQHVTHNGNDPQRRAAARDLQTQLTERIANCEQAGPRLRSAGERCWLPAAAPGPVSAECNARRRRRLCGMIIWARSPGCCQLAPTHPVNLGDRRHQRQTQAHSRRAAACVAAIEPRDTSVSPHWNTRTSSATVIHTLPSATVCTSTLMRPHRRCT